MSGRQSAYFSLHVAIFLFGYTAILGKLISLPGTTLVWYRMAITLASLCLFPNIWARLKSLPPDIRRKSAGIGILLALHWITFFESIKYANASIALSCMAATAFFTALIEPLVLRRQLRWHELLLGLLVILGFVLIFRYTADRFALGIVIGMISAILIAWVSVLNKVVVADRDVIAVTWVEFAAGLGFLSLGLPLYLGLFPLPYIPQGMDWGYLMILGLLCTTLAYTLTLHALRFLSAFTVTLSLNLEPVYGMLMAYLWFREDQELSVGFYVGSILILLTVAIHPIWSRWLDRRAQTKTAGP